MRKLSIQSDSNCSLPETCTSNYVFRTMITPLRIAIVQNHAFQREQRVKYRMQTRTPQRGWSLAMMRVLIALLVVVTPRRT